MLLLEFLTWKIAILITNKPVSDFFTTSYDVKWSRWNNQPSAVDYITARKLYLHVKIVGPTFQSMRS